MSLTLVNDIYTNSTETHCLTMNTMGTSQSYLGINFIIAYFKQEHNPYMKELRQCSLKHIPRAQHATRVSQKRAQRFKNPTSIGVGT